MSNLPNIINTIKELTKEKLVLKEQIKSLYLENEKVLSLGFSGGKDSSVTLVITLEALLEIPKEKRLKTLYILYSDTLMELLPVQAHTYKVLDNIKEFAKENDLPIVVMHSKPTLENTKWSMKFAKGIRTESQDNRWCTTRLKTDVQEKMLYDTFGTKDIETVSIVGSRKDESIDRAKRLEDNTIDGHLKGHSVYSKSLVFAPIEDFSTEDVWLTLRSSKIGREVLVAEELYALYASTNGEGEECQTILGNAGDGGLKPNCAQSQGRFGCWECGLQHGRDKALIGMQKDYPYIKHLIEFRNWSVSTRDGQWEKYRDVYNHRYFTRLQYNLDSHRFGFNAPGGMSLSARAEGLERLLLTEKRVNETINFKLISDEELDFIQHRWILEGDFELNAMQIAERYGRRIRISDEDRDLLAHAKVFHQSQGIWKAKVAYWYNIHADERFAVQFVKQIKENFSLEKVKSIINNINKTMDATIVPEYLKDMQLKNQFYPSEAMEKLIRREWEEDKVSFVTQALIHDYEETWSDEDEILDPLESEDVSMEDKYAMLDNWNTYVGSDSNERFENPEYMRFGGNFQYVNFRARQSDEYKEKKQELKRVKQSKKVLKLQKDSMTIQLAFDFAS
jgi:DNA sulfur modification protein DndC